MKIKIKLPVSTVSAIEKLFNHYINYYVVPEDFELYCHFQNIKQFKYYISKRLFLTSGSEVKLNIDHNIIFSILFMFSQTDQGVFILKCTDIHLQQLFNQLFKQAREKATLDINRQRALTLSNS